MAYLLFSDNEVWHREFKIKTPLYDMAGCDTVKRSFSNRCRIVASYSNIKEYRQDKTGYLFNIKRID